MAETSHSEQEVIRREIARLQGLLTKKESKSENAAPFSSVFKDRSFISTIIKSDDGGLSMVGQTVVVGGWVKVSGSGFFFKKKYSKKKQNNHIT